MKNGKMQILKMEIPVMKLVKLKLLKNLMEFLMKFRSLRLTRKYSYRNRVKGLEPRKMKSSDLTLRRLNYQKLAKLNLEMEKLLGQESFGTSINKDLEFLITEKPSLLTRLLLNTERLELLQMAKSQISWLLTNNILILPLLSNSLRSRRERTICSLRLV